LPGSHLEDPVRQIQSAVSSGRAGIDNSMEWIALAWSGVVATALAAAYFWIARSFHWTTFSPAVQLGCLVIPHPRRPITESVGMALLFLIGSSAGPRVYQGLLGLWGGPAWLGGLVFGGLIGVGSAAALPLLGLISACIRTGEMAPPGSFGLRWGRPTPVVVVTGNMVYGTVVAAILAGF
jgi:hypothetical protein